LAISWRYLGDFGDLLAIKKGEVSLLFIRRKKQGYRFINERIEMTLPAGKPMVLLGE